MQNRLRLWSLLALSCGLLSTLHAATATAKKGSLTIILEHGDFVTILPDDEGQVLVQGKVATLVNGEEEVVLPLSANLTVKAAKGASTVFMVNGADIPGKLTHTGSGAGTTLCLYEAVIGGNFKSDFKCVAGLFEIENCTFLGNVQIKMAKEDNEASFGPAEVAGNLTIQGGPGDDYLGFEDVLINGKLAIDLKQGGGELVGFDSMIEGPASFAMGAGQFALGMEGVVFMGATTIKKGAGELAGGMMSCENHGSLKAQIGPGQADMQFEGCEFFGKTDFSFKSAKQGEIGAEVNYNQNFIEGSFRLTLSNLPDVLSFQQNNLVAPLVEIRGLSGDDIFTVTGNEQDGNTFKLDGGKGDDALAVGAESITVTNVEAIDFVD